MAKNRKRGPRSKAAAEEVASSADLLWEILIRLPVKSLLNFKRVSRQWYDLISIPNFRLEHTRRNPNTSPAGLFLPALWGEYLKYVRFDKDYRVRNNSRAPCKFPKGVEILDSCNGLLLCSFGDESRYVCNPATKHVARIPDLLEAKENKIGSTILAFNPSTPEKYRLVCICDGDPQIYVYESKSGLWRHSAIITSNDFEKLPGDLSGIFWNGAVHWLGRSKEAVYSFDLNQDCLRRTATIPLRDNDVKYFGACQGHLYMLKFDSDCNPVRWIVYEMEHDFSCLSIKYSVRHGHFIRTLGDRDNNRVLCIFLGEDDQLFVVVTCHLKVYTYNAKNPNSFPVQTTLSSHYFHRKAYIYMQSLASV